MDHKWVTLEEVKHHLRYDDDSNDVNLSNYIRAAETTVNRYITKDVTDEATADIKVAVLMLVGYYDLNREPNKETVNYGNYLPDPVRSLLYDYRKPTAI